MPTHPTLSYGVYFMSQYGNNEMAHEPMRIASCFITTIPIMILFVIFRNKIMGNLTMGGVKE